MIFHCRITPAYAEKRSSTSFKISSYQDHPRLCGEKRTECYTKSAAWGSPPPMRGKVAVMHWFAMMQRITPAYAGKRAVSPGGRKVLRDHPRLCGEKSPISADRCVGMGSPPPMRGKGYVKCILGKCGGITPAYAGKRFRFTPVLFGLRDHPRLCGEKRNSQKLRGSTSGSPPPMRGKGKTISGASVSARITPAYAGKRIELCAERAVL